MRPLQGQSSQLQNKLPVSEMKNLNLLGTCDLYTVSKLSVVSLAEMEYGAGWSMGLDPAGPHS